MYYQEKEARELVIKAGLDLIKEQLIARTWGNISARISKDEFIITPSGRAYETLKKEDLVKVKITDCSYEGKYKPSSEALLHAKVYALRDNINFIVHTHQPYASALSVEGKDFPFAPVAKYGLPGQPSLARNVEKCVKDHPKDKSFLLERHGVLCLGENYDESFYLAHQLEQLSIKEYNSNHQKIDYKLTRKPYLDDYAQMFGYKLDNKNEDELSKKLIIEKNTLAANYAKKAKPMNMFDVLIQNIFYKLKYSKMRK